MGNFLPCLAHGANRRPMSSKATKQKLMNYCFDDYPMKKLLRKWKKAIRSRGHTTLNTSDAAEPAVSEDHLDENVEKGVIRVKVVLTKEEAARLLSMCIRGEEKTLVQLMSQLIQSRHASAGTLGSSHGGGWRPVLESIPEDR